MSASSSLSESLRLGAAIAATAVLAAVAALWAGAWAAAVLSGTTAGVALWHWRRLQRTAAGLAQARAVAVRAAHGDLGARVTQIHRYGRGEAQLLGDINRMLDLTEAFAREAEAAMRHASRQRYYRKIEATGLRGDFVKHARTVNAALDQMDRFAERNQEIAREIAGLAGAAGVGRLDARCDLAGKDGVDRTIAENLNGLLDVVEGTVRAMMTGLAALADGDLTRRLPKNAPGLFGELFDTFNQSADKLSVTVRSISDVAREVRFAADEIATGSVDLAQRSEHQVSSLEKTSASLDALVSMVKDTADRVMVTATRATDARTVAEAGGETATQAVAAIRRIEESSNKVAEIVSTVNEISFQTNLLALNAAVEAARAGDAGKGFAVVANEVRTLAQRTGMASKEIRSLITEALEQVSAGVTLVTEAGDSLASIHSSVATLSTEIGAITTATVEQSSGLEGINEAMSTMDDMTQRNAALVEQTSAAVQSLHRQSIRLADAVSVFKV